MKIADIQAELGIKYFQQAIAELELEAKDEYTWAEVNQLRQWKKESKRSGKSSRKCNPDCAETTSSGDVGQDFNAAAENMAEQAKESGKVTGQVLAQVFALSAQQEMAVSLKSSVFGLFTSAIAKASEQQLEASRSDIDPKFSLNSSKNSNKFLTAAVETQTTEIE